MNFKKWLAALLATACLVAVTTARAADADLKALMDRVNALEAKNAELERAANAEKGKDKALDNAAAATDAATSATANVTTGGTKVTLSGYIDTSFEFNGNDPSNNNNNFRVFDNDANGFNLHLAELSFGALPSKPGEAGFQLDLAFGSDVRVFKSTDKFVWNSQARANDFVDTDFKQAFIEYIIPVGCPGNKKGITLDFGKVRDMGRLRNDRSRRQHQFVPLAPIRLCDSVHPHWPSRDLQGLRQRLQQVATIGAALVNWLGQRTGPEPLQDRRAV